MSAVQPQAVRTDAAPTDVIVPEPGPVRRIREDVRDGVYVMAFSCVASTATALAMVALTRLAG